MAQKKPRPGRTLLAMLIGIALLYGAAALGDTWKPALGLDLEGGTRITLTATKVPTPDQLALARNIIEQRANAGVVESEVTTQGNRNIIVEVPGKNSQALVDTVKRTAQLRFRLVAGVAQGAPAASSPSASPSASPSGSPSASPSSKATAKPKKSKGAAGQNRAVPNWAKKATPKPKPKKSKTPKATPSPSASTAPETQPTGPMSVKKALAWQDAPDATSKAQFAKFVCPPKGNASATKDDPNKVLISCDDKGFKYLLSPALIEGTQLKSASYGQPQNAAQWVVNLSLKSSARGTFADVTKALAGTQKSFAIVLEDRKSVV